MAQSRGTPREDPESGVALILVVIFSVLLFVLVADLVTTARMASSTGRNDALMARMDNHIGMTLGDVLQLLKDDLDEGAAASEEGAADALGGAGGAGAAGGLGGAGAGADGEEEQEPPSDSSRDAWFKPAAYGDGDLTTYVWVEDENRKFNILTLMSPDEEFARDSRERLVRLITGLREGTLFEISNSNATTIVNAIEEWLKGLNRSEIDRPKPKLKSDSELSPDRSIPLHLDELLLLKGVDRTVFYDLVLEGPPVTMLPGLESVLTIYTSYRKDPGDANDPENAATPGNPAAAADAPATPQDTVAAAKAEGLGVAININTAPKAVLRSLLPPGEIPNSVIEGILRWRNEEVPEEEKAAAAAEEGLDYQGDVRDGGEIEKRIFASLEDLEEIAEFKTLDPQIKTRFTNLLTTESDVFTVHMACVFKRNEERRLFVMTRRRSVVVRLSGESGAALYPIIHLERRHGLRVQGVDFPEEEEERRLMQQDEMDSFSLEERKWNPFYVEFYDRKDDKTVR